MDNRAIEELLDLVRNQYPEDNYEGLIRLVIYSDGSGKIAETSMDLCHFDSIKDLVEHLSN